jgi:hypothetical protein
VLGDERPEWQPEVFEYELWGCQLRLRFPVAKLALLDTALLEAERNIFVTIVLLHRDAQETWTAPRERIRRKAARYRRMLSLGYSASDVRQLVRLADRLLRLPKAMVVEAREAMRAVEEEFAVTYITSYEELARDDERRRLVLDQLGYKCGPLDETVRARVEALSYDQLHGLSRALFDFTGEADVRAWLDQQATSAHSSDVEEDYVTSYKELAREEERRELILRLLARKCGVLDAELRERVVALDSNRLLVLGEDLLDFAGEDDLRAWLDRHSAA